MPARRDVPPPDPAATERVVAAALAALPRRRRRGVVAAGSLVVAAAAAAALALAPSGSGIPKGPLPFRSLTSGRATVDMLDRTNSSAFAIVFRRFADADGFVDLWGLPKATGAAIDRVDFRRSIVVVILDRRTIRPQRFTLRKLPTKQLQLCVDVRESGPSVAPDYMFAVAAVRKPAGLDAAVPGGEQIYPLMRAGGRLIPPGPTGFLRPRLCP